MSPKYVIYFLAFSYESKYTYSFSVASNWDYRVEAEWYLNLDVARYIWIAISILIDFIITWIPLEIIRHTRLRTWERRILFAAFSANLLGTVVWYVPNRRSK